MTDTIASLIARLEAGEVTYKLECDLMLFQSLHGPIGGRTPNYTTSLDAAIAFTEAVLPSRDYGFETEGPVKRRAWVAPAEAAVSIEAVAESAALALVLATLKAKMGEGK